jgi:hypothetical protein
MAGRAPPFGGRTLPGGKNVPAAAVHFCRAADGRAHPDQDPRVGFLALVGGTIRRGEVGVLQVKEASAGCRPDAVENGRVRRWLPPSGTGCGVVTRRIELIAQGPLADAQQLGRPCAIATGGLERTHDGSPLDLVQIER